MPFRLIFKCLAHITAIVHLLIIALNLLSVPFVVAYEPFYIWMPIITFLVSPLVGGTYCMFNRVENHFRRQAGMPEIYDRLGHFIEQITR